MQESSSSTDTIPDGHVLVGRIGKPHGLEGEFYVFPETDHPERFAVSSRLTVRGRMTKVISSRATEDRLIISVSLANNRPAAERLRGALITIPEEERRRLDDGEWWPEQLVGLEVFDHRGTARGTVAGVIEGVAQHRLVVRTSAGLFEIPFVEALVPVVDVDRGRVVLGDVEGLLTEA